MIVGAGPAGSSCAWRLRSSGLDVLILDRCKFPREKLCGGWITPDVFQVLQISPQEYGRARLLQAITGFRIGRIGSSGFDVDYARVVSYGIRRCEFDEYLLRRCGARCREETDVQSIERVNDTWIINGEIKARMLVGAGGHFCPVAKHVGEADTEQPVVAQEVEFQMHLRQEASCAVRAATVSRAMVLGRILYDPAVDALGATFGGVPWLSMLYTSPAATTTSRSNTPVVRRIRRRRCRASGNSASVSSLVARRGTLTG